MPVLRTFNVVPSLPEPLERLRDIAYNLFWTWEPRARSLFERLDRDLWEEVHQNPIRMLAEVSQDRLRELSQNESYLAHLNRVAGVMDHMLQGSTWFGDTHGESSGGPVAYFSMEFGLHTSLPIYSGGLGVLAGDHLKAASDLGLPLVGVGLFYSRGYFRQYLNSDGWQQERYPENPPDEMPLRLVRTPDGAPVRIAVDLPEGTAQCQIWRVDVGRIPLYLLDTELPDNDEPIRQLTGNLYGGDDAMRIKQEKLLGVGGLRALRALGIHPSACHMNEGHSAFLGLEWMRWLMETSGAGYEAVRQAVKAGTIFTTHTPVPAGNDEFPPDLVEACLHEFTSALGLSRAEFLALGRPPGAADDARFSMTLLALRLSSARNGVSALHGQVSRRMWQRIWPELPVEEVPIGSITNGVHVRTWLSDELSELYGRYLDPKWASESDDPEMWTRVERIPETELWSAHERCRERLVAYVRHRLAQQLSRRGAPAPEIERADEVLDPKALTIGFARRFATYKRATLLFRDIERLKRILSAEDEPVQVIFAGKAHPQDDAGKDFIRQIVHLSREAPFSNRFVFLEDYEMNLARYLVEGCDVWLNTPRRPMEASGTSGMKAAVNGVLNLSVLDGWWAEAYRPDLGWVIGSGESYQDAEYQDQVESEALYDVLEHEVVPLFYERGKDGTPRKWLSQMKRCIGELTPAFGMHRMVKEYANDFYVPTCRRHTRLTANGLAAANDLAGWLANVRKEWPTIEVRDVQADSEHNVPVGHQVTVRAVVRLGRLSPSDVRVELYHGSVGTEERIRDGEVIVMSPVEEGAGGTVLYQGQIPCERSGRFGFVARVVPSHPDLPSPQDTQLVAWG